MSGLAKKESRDRWSYWDTLRLRTHLKCVTGLKGVRRRARNIMSLFSVTWNSLGYPIVLDIVKDLL